MNIFLIENKWFKQYLDTKTSEAQTNSNIEVNRHTNTKLLDFGVLCD